MNITSKKRLLKWFGENLKRARKDKSLSQEALAEAAGIDFSYYGRVERGELAISVYKLYQVTKALDIPMRFLFSGEPARPKNEREDKLEELIQFLRQMDTEDLELLNSILPKLIEWKHKKTGGD